MGGSFIGLADTKRSKSVEEVDDGGGGCGDDVDDNHLHPFSCLKQRRLGLVMVKDRGGW